jgi:hypothetical protein
MNNAEVLMDTTNTTERRIPAGRLAWGLVLIFVGGYAFIDAIDLWNMRDVWRLWPVVAILIGGANELDALRARKSDGSFLLLSFGVWALFGTQHWLGLSMRSAFPIGFIVAGLFVCLHALIDDPLAAKKKKENEQ